MPVHAILFGVTVEAFLHKLIKAAIEYGVGYFILGSTATSLIRYLFKFFSNQSVYNDVLRSGRIKSILLKLGESRALLNASKILVTHIHNGQHWLNGNHIYKLSIYKTLSLYSRNHIETVLNDIRLSEISEILEKLNRVDYDIISVSELPNDFAFKKVLNRDKINYIVLFKIQKNKAPLGYIWVLFADEKEVNRDKAVYADLLYVADEIAEEFK